MLLLNFTATAKKMTSHIHRVIKHMIIYMCSEQALGSSDFWSTRTSRWSACNRKNNWQVNLV